MAGDGVRTATYAGKASAYAADYPLHEFVSWAIERWRELAKLDEPQHINSDDINKALEQIGSHA